MRPVALLIVAACGSRGSHGSRKVSVDALAGERAAPNASVIGHAPDGTVIDQTATDAVGRAEVGVDDDSLVSVIFAGVDTSIVTVPAQGELAIHGPAHDTPPLIVGVLQVDGPPLPAASHFTVQLGCATVVAPKLPADIDVGACSMGSDTQLDVLVRGLDDANAVVGYAAARVAMTGGLADLAIASWQTTTTNVPITLAGVAPAIELALLCDGLPFQAPVLADHAEVWTGLVVDATRMRAAIGSAQLTTREQPGAPSSIALGPDDFLPAIELTTTLGESAFTWQPANLGDAVNLHATWSGPDDRRTTWDAVLPPDTGDVALPAAQVEPITAGVDVALRYLDAGAYEDFAALLAAGIHAEQLVGANPIVVGDQRVSQTIGVR